MRTLIGKATSVKMPIWILAVVGLAAVQFVHGEAAEAPEVSSDAVVNRDFTLTDSHGKSHTLSSYKGQYVVLEWVNFDCPFVKKHYRSGHMPRLQEAYAAKGVIWLAICSSAPKKQGYYQGEALTSRIAEEKFKGSAFLLDPDGRSESCTKPRPRPTCLFITLNLN